jgi:hypothetical protein
MKNLLVGISNGLFPTNNARVSLNKQTTDTTSEPQDFIIVSTTVVKNHGESLLIVLQEATVELAESGNTLFSIITNVFPVPFGITPKNLQVYYTHSYNLSLF